MIYLCWNCDWRINERWSVHQQKIITDRMGIGYVQYMFRHHPFCSAQCIEEYKEKYKNGDKDRKFPPISDLSEQLSYYHKNGEKIYENWKTLRKINRIRVKNRS